MKTCDIKISVTANGDDVSVFTFAAAVMAYLTELKAVKTPEGFDISAHVGEPRNTRALKAAVTAPKPDDAGPIPTHLKRG